MVAEPSDTSIDVAHGLRPGPRQETLRTCLRIAALAASYVATAKYGLMLGAVGGFATLVWPPTGIALACLMRAGVVLWPGVCLGAFVVNVWSGAPVAAAAGIALGNTAEAVLGTLAMARFAGFRGAFDRLRHVLVLITVALTSTTISATTGVLSLALTHTIEPHRLAEAWRAWWVGDVLGALLVAPLLLTWTPVIVPLSGRQWPRARGLRVAEALALAVVLTGASAAVFLRAPPNLAYPFESPYILFPLFVWAALRFELRGATLATALASCIAIIGTARGCGPFVRESLTTSLLALQTFMGCAALTPLVVAGATTERARAVRVRESFAASVSHDLKNPLGAIRMSADALAKGAPEPFGQRVHKHEDLVRRSVERMLHLIDNLLDATAIDAGQLSVDLRPEDARALVTEAVDALQPLASSKGQTLRGDAEALRVLCDRERVLQVLSNLIGNAIKFTGPAGVISLTVRRWRSAALICVEDTGGGIAPDELRGVFERYRHAKAAAGGGTGLGLAIAKGIVEAHGGAMWVRSRVGVGSAFYFTLPTSDAL
ncbi:MAG TPA: MASE1 domain-containing protein [Polyangiaceae bacterium]|nr:MASE1 domain-containing protein [Polyangiaceae bacterium]